MTPPDKFVHPLNSEPFLVRLWIATKRILFLLRCFTPFAFVTVVYLLHGTPERRAYWVECLVHSLESAGCTFQKFGQWMSMRPDMLPPDIILALSRLRDDVPQHNMEHNRAIFRCNFGLELEEIFSSFDSEPIASGTVAQVHRATIRHTHTPDGKEREVAVKVRHPDVVAETFVDIDLIFSFINTLGEVAGHLTIPFKKDEFHSVLQRQIDFRWEAHNLFRFGQNFHNDSGVMFPEVMEEFYSSSVLVESWVNGRKITDMFTELTEGFAVNEKAVGPARVFDAREAAEKRKLAGQLFAATMQMFLRDNFIHGDLHGGNVLFGAGCGRATVIDAGVVTSIEEGFTQPFASFLLALCRGDVTELSDRLLQFNQAASFDEAAFRKDIEVTTRRWVGEAGRAPDGGIINLGDLVGEILFKIQKNDLHLRGDVASTIVTMSLVEGLVKQLDPEFDVVGTALPYFKRYYPNGVHTP